MIKTTNPLSVPSFGTIEDRQHYLNNKSVKDYLCLGTLATAFFIIADFVPLYIKWTAVQQDNWYFVALLAAVSAVILDLPMYLAGRKIREYLDRLISKKEMLPTVILAAIAFLFVYIPFFIFSIATKDATFEEALPLGSASGFSFGSTGGSTDGNPGSVFVAAVFSAVLPLGTSISSLVVGLCTYSPLKERLKKLQRVKLLAQEHKTRLNEGIAQVTDRMGLLKARENDLFENYKNEVYAQEQIRIQSYEEALEEALDAEGILRVTENAFQYLDESGFNDDCRPLTLDELNDPVIEESKGMTTLTPSANAFGSVA